MYTDVVQRWRVTFGVSGPLIYTSVLDMGRLWERLLVALAGAPRLILFDDIVDSAGTLCNAAQSLMDAGAVEVSAYVTHGVLSGAAHDRVAKSVLKELVITDSIEASDLVAGNPKIRHVSCDRLIGEAIRRIANEESVSKLFD